jgi:hypothetical protein
MMTALHIGEDGYDGFFAAATNRLRYGVSN